MTGLSCIPNIGRRERRRRLLAGLALAAATAGAAAWAVASGTPRPWRMLLFLPAWMAALSLLQVRAHTCVLLAARGLRNMDAGIEPIASVGELAATRAQARAVHVQAACVAAVVTVAAMVA